MAYQPGDLVWVKIPRYPWWPAQVISEEDCPVQYLGSKTVIAHVKFLNEDCFEDVIGFENIQKLDCTDLKLLTQKGLTNKLFWERFRSAIKDAEKRSGISLLDEIPEDQNTPTFPSNEQNCNNCSNNKRSKKGETSSKLSGKRKRSDVENKKDRKKQRDGEQSRKVRKKNSSKKQKCSFELTPSRKTLKCLPNFDFDSVADVPTLLNSASTYVKSKTVLSKLSFRKNSQKDRNSTSVDSKCIEGLNSSGLEPMPLYTSDYESSPGICHSPQPSRILDDSSCSFDLPTPSSSSFYGDKRCSFDPNVQKDDCDSSDSDVELPEGLSPVTGGSVTEKDIVLIKWKKFPFWPAYVKKVYQRKHQQEKLSVIFVNPVENSPVEKMTLRYHRKIVLPFNEREKSKVLENLQEENSIQFRKACELAEDYLDKKVLGRWKKGIPGLPDTQDSDSDDGKLNCDNFDVPMSDSASECSSLSGVHDITPLDNYGDAKHQKRYEKMKEKYQNVVDYITSEEMKIYLLDIYHEKRKSDRHNKFFSERSKERASIKNAGFGPIADEVQHETIITTLLQWYTEASGKKEGQLPDYGYVMDVWIPESVIQSLVKVKGCCRSRAISRFQNGVKLTKGEKAQVHHSLLDSAKNVSEEDWNNHEEKRNNKLKQLGIDVTVSRSKKVLKLNKLTPGVL